jgi:hypothetical protein
MFEFEDWEYLEYRSSEGVQSLYVKVDLVGYEALEVSSLDDGGWVATCNARMNDEIVEVHSMEFVLLEDAIDYCEAQEMILAGNVLVQETKLSNMISLEEQRMKEEKKQMKRI